MKRLFLTLYFWAVMPIMFAQSVQAGVAPLPLTPGNVVISDPFHLGFSLKEYQPDGSLVQSVPIEQPTYPGSAGGVTFDDQGLLWLYNGDLEPYLSSWDSEQNIWTHQTCPGWSSFLCFPCQGIGAAGDYVFATDMGAYGNPNGIVRFAREGDGCTRFSEGRNYSALAVGLNGLVYARRADDYEPPPPTVVDVFDPDTLELVDSVTLSDRTLAIGADEAGHIYGVWAQSILHYSPGGTLMEQHQVVNSGYLYTLALSPDGRFIAVSDEAEVVITDAGFVPLHTFSILPYSWAYAAIVPQEMAVVDGDGDGVPDESDACPDTGAGEATDASGCSLDQLVPCDGPLAGGAWKNHGRYVSAFARAAEDFMEQGLITWEEKDALVAVAAQSGCGKR